MGRRDPAGARVAIGILIDHAGQAVFLGDDGSGLVFAEIGSGVGDGAADIVQIPGAGAGSGRWTHRRSLGRTAEGAGGRADTIGR